MEQHKVTSSWTVSIAWYSCTLWSVHCSLLPSMFVFCPTSTVTQHCHHDLSGTEMLSDKVAPLVRRLDAGVSPFALAHIAESCALEDAIGQLSQSSCSHQRQRSVILSTSTVLLLCSDILMTYCSKFWCDSGWAWCCFLCNNRETHTLGYTYTNSTFII